MGDFLDVLAKDCRETIESGYYNLEDPCIDMKHRLSLRDSLASCSQNAIIAEIKRSSPSKRQTVNKFDAGKVASNMERGGASAISVLTEPKHFKGSLLDLISARKNVSIPVLMKDIIIDQTQIHAASLIGADAILLIEAIFDRGYSNLSLGCMIKCAHSYGLEVLLETHTEEEFRDAVGSEADIVGINNRDLKTLSVDIGRTVRILKKIKGFAPFVVSESGIVSQSDLRFLRCAGAKAFLIGTSIISAVDVEKKVRELVVA
jgi:indole-3-glycerol phosphate synthase